MKKIILSLILLSPLVVFAQTFHLDGFWNLNFKESKAACQKKILSKYGYVPEKGGSNDLSLTYKNIKFGGNNCAGAVLGFIEDQLFMGKLILQAETPQKLLKLYKSIVYEISMKYHQPNESSYKFLYPYSGNLQEGQELIAVEGGYSDIFSKWTFEELGGSKSIIELEVDKEGYLLLTYGYGPLYERFLQMLSNKNSSQY